MTDDTPTIDDDHESPVGVVLPGDNRAMVANSRPAPSCWIGQIRTTWSNGVVTAGTGVLYGELHVLTCAHNFLRGGDEGVIRAVRAQFTMGLNRGPNGGPAPASPYAGVAVPLDAFQAPGQYSSAGGPPTPPDPNGVPEREVTEYLYDIAVARIHAMSVPAPPGESHFVLGPLPSGQVPSRLIGYSGDRDRQSATQYDRTGASALGGDFLQYGMSTFHGDSGAPVFYPDPNRPFYRIIGVHVSGVAGAWNFAVPLTPSYIDTVGALIRSIDDGQGLPLG
jgi:V8-like Glu-specific endopeptidase